MKQEIFVKELEKLKIDNSKLEKLEIYYDFLKRYNEHTNLTTIIDKEEVYLKHFYDSLTISKVIDLNNYKTLLDIGTGAGFPGLVLKIFFPHLEVTLIDSNNKKITFLEKIVEKLNLKNIDIIHKRSEEYVKNKRESFDIVTSRAVAGLNILLELSIPFVKTSGFFIPLKGNVDKELQNTKKALKKLNCKIIKKEDFLLPIEKSQRTLLLIQKTKQTDLIYPRDYSKIKKRPL